ncbi:MAG: hypothetical protein JXA67_00170 [Micromonosporaceae bacterium]|nr:hypothetical protein [Micromonosporaceae bacterium]
MFLYGAEAKTGKNRIHFDLYSPAATRADLARRLVDLGGSVLAEHATFAVLADPEGNELCLSND